MKYLLVYIIIILGLGLTFNVNAENHTNDLKKVNEQLNSIKKLLDTGVLDEDSYNQSKNRLDKRKQILLSKDKKKKKSVSKESEVLEKKIEVLEFPELGMEAVWKIEVEDFPAFIVVDNKGNDFFKN